MKTSRIIPGPKVWAEVELVKENLDFTFTENLRLHEVVAVWYWELDRELGTVGETFLHKSKLKPHPCRLREVMENKQKPFRDCMEGYYLREVPPPLGIRGRKLGSLVRSIKLWTDSLRIHGGSSRIHAIEINWEMPWDCVVAAFDEWGKKQSAYRKKAWCFEGESGENEPDPTPSWPSVVKGRKDFCDKWLKDLAIYRIAMAKMPEKEGKKLLLSLGVIDPKPEISSPNWHHSVALCRERIRLYKAVVESLPDSPFDGAKRTFQWIDKTSGTTVSQRKFARDRVRPDTELAWSLLKYFTKPSIQSAGRTPRDIVISYGPSEEWVFSKSDIVLSSRAILSE